MSYEKICEEIKKYLNDVDSFEDEAVEISNFIDDKVRERMRRKMCDCNKNYGNKDLQGVHDIDCESRKRRKELEDKAVGRILTEHNLDIIDYLNDDDTKQFLELEYELGYSDYNPIH